MSAVYLHTTLVDVVTKLDPYARVTKFRRVFQRAAETTKNQQFSTQTLTKFSELKIISFRPLILGDFNADFQVSFNADFDDIFKGECACAT